MSEQIITSQADAEAFAQANQKVRKPRAADVHLAPFHRRGLRLSIEPKKGEPCAFYWRWRAAGRPLGSMQTMTASQAYARMIQQMDGAEKPAKKPRTPTLNQYFEQWASERDGKPSTKIYRSVWRNTVAAAGDLVMADMVRADYVRILKEAHKRGAAPTGIHRTHTLMGQLIKWADYNHDLTPVTLPPMTAIFDGDDAPEKSEKRQAVIDLNDWREFWHYLAGHHGSTAALLMLIMTTGVRKSEATGIVASEVKEHAWTIPAARMKQRKAHTIPRFPVLDSVLARSRRTDGLLFGADANGTPSPKRTVAASTLNNRLKRYGLHAWITDPDTNERRAVPATVHDLRRTMTTFAIRYAGIDEVTAQRMIAHAVKLNEVAAVYAVAGVADAEKTAEGWQKWGDWFASIIEAR